MKKKTIKGFMNRDDLKLMSNPHKFISTRSPEQELTKICIWKLLDNVYINSDATKVKITIEELK